jgi:hypothetical protein
MKHTGSTKLKQVAKSTKVEPVREPLVPLQLEVPVKRGRGRPRKQNPFDNTAPAHMAEDPKALVVFRRAMADAEKAMMTPADFDGGGTTADSPVVTKESLQRRVARRLNVLDRFLTDDKLIELLSFSSLKEVGIYEGIMLDKSLVLTGQPTVIIGESDRANMDSIMPRLLTELNRRKLITSVSERKIEFTNP